MGVLQGSRGLSTYVTGTDEVGGQAFDDGVAVTTLLVLAVETDEDTLTGLDGSDTGGTLERGKTKREENRTIRDVWSL